MPTQVRILSPPSNESSEWPRTARKPFRRQASSWPTCFSRRVRRSPWPRSNYLELGILWTPEADCASSIDFTRRDEPAAPVAGHHEEVVEARPLQSLHDAVPTSISPTRAGGNYPPVISPAG